MQRLSISHTSKQHRILIPVMMFVLLFALWAYSGHHHDDNVGNKDTDCQLCQFGAHASTPLPSIESPSIIELPEIRVVTLTLFPYTPIHVRFSDPRAPPFSV